MNDLKSTLYRAVLFLSLWQKAQEVDNHALLQSVAHAGGSAKPLRRQRNTRTPCRFNRPLEYHGTPRLSPPSGWHRPGHPSTPGRLQPSALGRGFGFGPPPAAAQPLPTFARAHDDTLLLERLLPRGLWPDHGIQRLPIVPRAEEVKYKTEWTHPARLEDGFVGDFAPVETIDIVDEGEANETSTALACARCSDPLLLGSNDNSLTPDEVRRRRVWGLRCGHVIDGKCLEELYKPLEEEEAPAPPSKRKGKGKARARDRMEEEVDPTDVEDDASGLLPAPISTRLRSRAMLGVAE
ncbi:unnamed protein product, partial [Mycena citricolor]